METFVAKSEELINEHGDQTEFHLYKNGDVYFYVATKDGFQLPRLTNKEFFEKFKMKPNKALDKLQSGCSYVDLTKDQFINLFNHYSESIIDKYILNKVKSEERDSYVFKIKPYSFDLVRGYNSSNPFKFDISSNFDITDINGQPRNFSFIVSIEEAEQFEFIKVDKMEESTVPNTYTNRNKILNLFSEQFLDKMVDDYDAYFESMPIEFEDDKMKIFDKVNYVLDETKNRYSFIYESAIANMCDSISKSKDYDELLDLEDNIYELAMEFQAKPIKKTFSKLNKAISKRKNNAVKNAKKQLIYVLKGPTGVGKSWLLTHMLFGMSKKTYKEFGNSNNLYITPIANQVGSLTIDIVDKLHDKRFMESFGEDKPKTIFVVNEAYKKTEREIINGIDVIFINAKDYFPNKIIKVVRKDGVTYDEFDTEKSITYGILTTQKTITGFDVDASDPDEIPTIIKTNEIYDRIDTDGDWIILRDEIHMGGSADTKNSTADNFNSIHETFKGSIFTFLYRINALFKFATTATTRKIHHESEYYNVFHTITKDESIGHLKLRGTIRKSEFTIDNILKATATLLLENDEINQNEILNDFAKTIGVDGFKNVLMIKAENASESGHNLDIQTIVSSITTLLEENGLPANMVVSQGTHHYEDGTKKNDSFYGDGTPAKDFDELKRALEDPRNPACILVGNKAISTGIDIRPIHRIIFPSASKPMIDKYEIMQRSLTVGITPNISPDKSEVLQTAGRGSRASIKGLTVREALRNFHLYCKKNKIENTGGYIKAFTLFKNHLSLSLDFPDQDIYHGIGGVVEDLESSFMLTMNENSDFLSEVKNWSSRLFDTIGKTPKILKDDRIHALILLTVFSKMYFSKTKYAHHKIQGFTTELSLVLEKILAAGLDDLFKYDNSNNNAKWVGKARGKADVQLKSWLEEDFDDLFSEALIDIKVTGDNQLIVRRGSKFKDDMVYYIIQMKNKVPHRIIVTTIDPLLVKLNGEGDGATLTVNLNTLVENGAYHIDLTPENVSNLFSSLIDMYENGPLEEENIISLGLAKELDGKSIDELKQYQKMIENLILNKSLEDTE